MDRLVVPEKDTEIFRNATEPCEVLDESGNRIGWFRPTEWPNRASGVNDRPSLDDKNGGSEAKSANH